MNPTLINLQMGVVGGTTGYDWDTAACEASTENMSGLQLELAALTESLATSGDATTYMWHISPFCKDPAAAMRVPTMLFDRECAVCADHDRELMERLLDEPWVFPGRKNMIAIFGIDPNLGY